MGQKDVINAINSQGDTTFKTVNNLLSLQDNHVEEFFQYHGEAFLGAFEKLMEDVIERVVSQMLAKLAFNISRGKATIMPDAMREFEKYSENIDLDIQKILQSALNQAINQRKMAKQQYLEYSRLWRPNGGSGCIWRWCYGWGYGGRLSDAKRHAKRLRLSRSTCRNRRIWSSLLD